MNPRERELIDLLAARTSGIELPHTDCNFAAPTAPLSRRGIMDRHRAGPPTTPRGDNISNLPLPLTNRERDAAPRLNVFDQALVTEKTQSLFEPVPVPPPPPDLYPLLARGPNISAIYGKVELPAHERTLRVLLALASLCNRFARPARTGTVPQVPTWYRHGLTFVT
jgi:hypothetical protein